MSRVVVVRTMVAVATLVVVAAVVCCSGCGQEAAPIHSKTLGFLPYPMNGASMSDEPVTRCAWKPSISVSAASLA